MNFWITFWTIVFLICLLIFAGVAVAVTIGGARELRALFRPRAADPD